MLSLFGLFICLLAVFFLLCGTGPQPWETISPTEAKPSKLSQTYPESHLPSDPRVSQTGNVNHNGNPCSMTGEIHYKTIGDISIGQRARRKCHPMHGESMPHVNIKCW